uniref:Regulator of rDNA transcription protein 8 n=1 Tax=Anthurium amnicola TaxID=1678845 RepID=A0A1D1YQD9_9ARAE
MILPPSAYPIKGIFYFFSNWILIRRIICVLFLTLIVAILALGLTFSFLLSLQAHALIVAGCPVWLAWTVSVIFCLLEAVVFTIIFYLIITPLWQDALFDEVLRLKGLGYVLDKQKTTSELTLCCRGLCSGLSLALASIYAIVIVQIIALLITMPLHAIPIVGTIIYCYINGWVLAWGHQIHYHTEIKEWTVKQSLNFAWKNREDYSTFGFVAVALELIPIANFIFFWTNVVGAALWAADVIIDEQKLLSRDDNRAGSSSYQAAQRMDASNTKYGSTEQ